MASFGGLQPSVENILDDSVITSKHQQKADAAPQAFPTPQPTPEADVARNKMDKKRQQTDRKQQKTNVTQPAPSTATSEPTPPDESNKKSHQAQKQTTDLKNAASQASKVTTSEFTSKPDSAHENAQQQTAAAEHTAHSDQSDAPSAQSKPSFDGGSVPTSPEVTESQSGEQQKSHHSVKDKKVVDRILNCDPQNYYQILGVPDKCKDEEATTAYKELSSLLNADTNKYPAAQDALKKVRDAASRLGVSTEEFAGNASGDEFDTDEAEAYDPEDGSPPPPDDFSKSIYIQAGPYLGKLMENPDDAVAKTALDNLNMKIEKNNQNTMHDGPQDDFTIRYGLFIGNFQIARKSLDVLKEHPQDAEALKRIEKINRILTKINKRYDYPAEWIIKPTLKTKTEAWRPGLTRKGEPILAYRTIGGDGHGNPRGYQFVVQTGTKDNPLYDLRSGGEIGRKAADGYRNMGKDKIVRLGEADKKYSRKDADAFQKILGVASKPIETKTIGTGFQYPVASIYVLCRRTTEDGVKEWRDFVFRQTLRRMLGKTDADEEIKEYYENRNLRPPWKVAHTKTRLPKKEKKRQKAAARQTLSSEETSEYESSEIESSEDEELEDEIVENEEEKNVKMNEFERSIADMQSKQDKLESMLAEVLRMQKSGQT